MAHIKLCQEGRSHAKCSYYNNRNKKLVVRQWGTGERPSCLVSEQQGKFSNEEDSWGNSWAAGVLGSIATQQNAHNCQKTDFVYDIIHFLYDKKKVKKLLEYHFHGLQIVCVLAHLSLWCIHPFRIDCRNSFMQKSTYLLEKERERKNKMWIFIFLKIKICMTNGMKY